MKMQERPESSTHSTTLSTPLSQSALIKSWIPSCSWQSSSPPHPLKGEFQLHPHGLSLDVWIRRLRECSFCNNFQTVAHNPCKKRHCWSGSICLPNSCPISTLIFYPYVCNFKEPCCWHAIKAKLHCELTTSSLKILLFQLLFLLYRLKYGRRSRGWMC